jgi:hypothetical protein
VKRLLAAGSSVAAGVVVALAISASPSEGAGQSCSVVEPVDGSTRVSAPNGVTLIKPPASVPAGTQLVIGARYPSSSPYKSVYAFLSSSRGGSAIGEKFLTGSGSSLRCATLGQKVPAGATRYITYQLVPKKQGGKRTKIVYRVTVQQGTSTTPTTTTTTPTSTTPSP